MIFVSTLWHSLCSHLYRVCYGCYSLINCKLCFVSGSWGFCAQVGPRGSPVRFFAPKQWVFTLVRISRGEESEEPEGGKDHLESRIDFWLPDLRGRTLCLAAPFVCNSFEHMIEIDWYSFLGTLQHLIFEINGDVMFATLQHMILEIHWDWFLQLFWGHEFGTFEYRTLRSEFGRRLFALEFLISLIFTFFISVFFIPCFKIDEPGSSHPVRVRL
jgi:hypothetical protein